MMSNFMDIFFLLIYNLYMKTLIALNIISAMLFTPIRPASVTVKSNTYSISVTSSYHYDKGPGDETFYVMTLSIGISDGGTGSFAIGFNRTFPKNFVCYNCRVYAFGNDYVNVDICNTTSATIDFYLAQTTVQGWANWSQYGYQYWATNGDSLLKPLSLNVTNGFHTGLATGSGGTSYNYTTILNAINSNLDSIESIDSNGFANIRTDLGVIKTSMGTIQTSLNGLETTANSLLDSSLDISSKLDDILDAIRNIDFNVNIDGPTDDNPVTMPNTKPLEDDLIIDMNDRFNNLIVPDLSLDDSLTSGSTFIKQSMTEVLTPLLETDFRYVLLICAILIVLGVIIR